MDKLIYKRECSTADSGEPETIEFELAKTLPIEEFKVACVRLALALGYHYAGIVNEFGPLADEPKSKRILLND